MLKPKDRPVVRSWVRETVAAAFAGKLQWAYLALFGLACAVVGWMLG